MAKVFISFLGIGNPTKEKGYDTVAYRFENDGAEYKTMFAQRAIIEKHGADTFDRICLMMTPESRDKHRKLLIDELINIGCVADRIFEDHSITTNQNTEQQWEWFDSLQQLIKDGDEVVFDFTHGFRSVPIIFSTAISFLQKVKRFTLLNAHYGYVTDYPPTKGEIIDMAKFYRINEWADGVSRLVDMADASKLAELADEGQDDGFAALNDKKLTQALRNLTDLIKNIDVNNVGKQADEALKLVAEKQKRCSGADAQLLQMVLDKFSHLAIQGSGRYDSAYFQLQLVLTKMLLKHGLNMQAFTVMRECIASIGMLGATGKYAEADLKSNDGRRYRKNIGELFVGLCITAREKWRQADEAKRSSLSKEDLRYFDTMMEPFYAQLESLSIAPVLHQLASEMSEYRNGLDHAWTSKKEAPADIPQKGQQYFVELTCVITLLRESQIIKS